MKELEEAMQQVKEEGHSTIVYKRHGIRVKDSRRSLAVEVTPEDIEGSVCRDHQKCVIARAIKRTMSAVWVDVGTETVLIGTSPNEARRFHLSQMAKKQVYFFDTHNGRFAPCKVQLLAPPPSKRLGWAIGQGRNLRARLLRRSLKRRAPTR